MTLEEGHWILVFERSIVQNKGKAQAPLAKKEKNLTPDCLSIVNQMECLCFMTQRTIVHFRWNMMEYDMEINSFYNLHSQNSTRYLILICEIKVTQYNLPKSLKDHLLLVIYCGPTVYNCF